MRRIYIYKIAHFRNLRGENSSGIPAHWIYRSMNLVIELLSANHIALNNYTFVDMELQDNL